MFSVDVSVCVLFGLLCVVYIAMFVCIENGDARYDYCCGMVMLSVSGAYCVDACVSVQWCVLIRWRLLY